MKESFRQRLKRGAAALMADVAVLARAMFDPETPWYVRLLVFLIVAYVMSPVDLIPDFIPVLGVLDEIILVPLALRLAVRSLPPAVLARCRQAPAGQGTPAYFRTAGVIVVVSLWLILIALAMLLLRG